jgi:hypothetical protein
MSTRAATFALIASAALLAACTTPQQRVQYHEDLLAAAGFVARPANTPECQQEVQSLPPNRFVQKPQGNGFVYVYADPLVCNCLYIGDQAAYGRYQRDVLNRRIANEDKTTAEIAAQEWDVDP